MTWAESNLRHHPSCCSTSPGPLFVHSARRSGSTFLQFSRPAFPSTSPPCSLEGAPSPCHPHYPHRHRGAPPDERHCRWGLRGSHADQKGRGIYKAPHSSASVDGIPMACVVLPLYISPGGVYLSCQVWVGSMGSGILNKRLGASGILNPAGSEMGGVVGARGSWLWTSYSRAASS